ncbi:MAG TPA: DMT family transporter [Burkholderiales bacterium]|nr:DMT family transporter [Burkholderiales bacterium]
MRGMPLAALFAGAACIALSPIWVRVADVGPTASAFWRVALAAPLLWILFFSIKTNETKKPGLPLAAALAAGCAFAGDLAFWHWSIQYTSVANSTLLANLASIFVTLAAWVLWKQRPSGVFLAGLAAALAGTAVLVRASVSFSPTALLGDALGVVTALFYAWYLMSVKSLRDRGAGTLALMAATTTITALLLLPVAAASAQLSGQALLPSSAAGWLTLAGLAWISHAGGQGLIAFALAHLPASFSAVGLLLQPMLAGAFAWLLLAEPLGALQCAGGAVVLFGIYLAHRGRDGR